jgi:5'-nucleotidase
MTAASLPLARVLIANDDGIRAKGLAVLEEVMAPLAREVWVVAPETEQSAASHSLTMRRPLFVRRVEGERRFTVDGTPTDCVLLAVHHIMAETPPDLILSGINQGGNLGEDAIYSGTVAAAREGALLGFRAVALSQMYDHRHPVPWQVAAAWTPPLLERLFAAGWPDGVVINVNFPDRPNGDVAGIAVTRQGRRKIGAAMQRGFDPRGEPYFWIGGDRDEDVSVPGSDLEAVHRGCVAVTPLALDATHEPTLQRLKAALG